MGGAAAAVLWYTNRKRGYPRGDGRFPALVCKLWAGNGFFCLGTKLCQVLILHIIAHILCVCQVLLYTFYVNLTKNSVFAQNLSRIRKQRGFSQAELAEMAGLTRRIINHYETHVSQPSIEKVEAIANALKIKTSELLDRNSKAVRIDKNIDLTGIDPRSVKKLKDILSLPADDRNDLYRILNKMVRKNQLEKQKA